MSRFAFALVALTIVTTLISAFFGLLPDSPFSEIVIELVAFLHSETVSQGLSWLAWFFPIGNVVNWIPAVVNAILAFCSARMILIALNVL